MPDSTTGTRARGLFITATDTGVGKTYVTALIARIMWEQGVRTGACKPVCSGAEVRSDGSLDWPDVTALATSLGNRFERDRICPQRFLAPLAPPVAARAEGRNVDAEQLRTAVRWWETRVDLLLVEGVGGLLCPLTERGTVADFAVELGYPLLIVARLGLGTLNHTLLTVEAALQRGLRIAGILLNDVAPTETGIERDSNPQELAARCPVPLLGVLPHGSSGELLRGGDRIKMDWLSLAEVPSR